jgi:RecB family exonuclease
MEVKAESELGLVAPKALDDIWLSASVMKTYKQCPRKYYYQYVKKVPRDTDPEQVKVGNLIHAILEDFHNEMKAAPLGPTEWKPRLILLAQKHQKKINLTKEQAEEAKLYLKYYLDHLAENGLPNMVSAEKKFKIILENQIIVTGYIDRIDEDQGTYHIIDYKTGKSKYLDEQQLMIYALAMFREFPDLVKFKCSYLMIAEKCRSLPYVFSVTDVTRAEQEIQKTAAEIRSDQTWEAKVGFLCKYCDFNAICPDVPDRYRSNDNPISIKRNEWL